MNYMLNQPLAANTKTTTDGDPDPGDCCTVPGGGDPGPGGPTG